MDLLKIGAEIFMNKIGASDKGLDLGNVITSLSSLLPTSESGEIDIAGLVGKLQSGGLASLAASFLSDGPNQNFSATDLIGLFGESKIEKFASDLNIDKSTAANGLSEMIPELVDKQSSGGSLLSSIGGAAASNILGKLF